MLFVNFLNGAAEKHMPGLKKITKLSTITSLIAFEKDLVITTFPEIDKMVRLFLTSQAGPFLPPPLPPGRGGGALAGAPKKY